MGIDARLLPSEIRSFSGPKLDELAWGCAVPLGRLSRHHVSATPSLAGQIDWEFDWEELSGFQTLPVGAIPVRASLLIWRNELCPRCVPIVSKYFGARSIVDGETLGTSLESSLEVALLVPKTIVQKSNSCNSTISLETLSQLPPQNVAFPPYSIPSDMTAVTTSLEEEGSPDQSILSPASDRSTCMWEIDFNPQDNAAHSHAGTSCQLAVG
ncbi:hypothetical protein BJ166DRAFT_574591 [Pestalotiopsis sp. NC0098]|nr:hypothetical protein BJ166DRAFT_574591 [Pestalotiopsis sp. NC0098]